MKELVIISGKGGTGKTSIAASFAYLAKNKVVVDCDVDASNMHIIMDPNVVKKETYEGRNEPLIDYNVCINCGKCSRLCQFNAISLIDEKYVVNSFKCEGCQVCGWFCPAGAIEMKPKVSGHWFISNSRNGLFVHAELGIAENNSGKLVSKVRDQARELAEKNNCEMIIIDGPPGISCPVIASITGVSLVLIVIEPTISGLHDVKRVVKLIKHFNIKGLVCINKFDINPEMANKIESFCEKNNIKILSKVSYDSGFAKAQMEMKSIVEFQDSGAAREVKTLWNEVYKELINL